MIGIFILIYGKQEVGKTVSTLLSAPLPIRYFDPENRSLKRTLEVVLPLRPKLKEKDNFKEIVYENLYETYNTLNNYEKEFGNKGSLIFDSQTAFMNIEVLNELQNQDYEGRVVDDISPQTAKQKAKDLIAQTKTSLEMYGSLASHMLRITNLLKKISKKGTLVICTALEDSSPKWCPEYDYAPTFSGERYGKDMPGNPDLIGRVISHRHIKDKKCKWCKKVANKNEMIYPPIIRFRSKGDIKWLDKWSGKGIRTDWPLNWEKILK